MRNRAAEGSGKEPREKELNAKIRRDSGEEECKGGEQVILRPLDRLKGTVNAGEVTQVKEEKKDGKRSLAGSS